MRADLAKISLMLLCLLARPCFADDDADRPFPSDRPGKANGPFTVDAGQFAVESDFVNGIFDRDAASVSRSVTAGDPLLKMGVTHDLDLELQIGGYQWNDFKDRASGTKTHVQGWGDETLRLKYNVMGNDGSDFALALLPYVKMPTASSALRNAGIGNNRVEGGLAVPMNYNLPHDFALGYQTEVDALKNDDNGNIHANFVNIALISHAVPTIKELTATLELYSSVSARSTSPNIYTLDPSFAYQLTPNLAFDVETDIGLNRAAPDLETICGVAWLF